MWLHIGMAVLAVVAIGGGLLTWALCRVAALPTPKRDGSESKLGPESLVDSSQEPGNRGSGPRP